MRLVACAGLRYLSGLSLSSELSSNPTALLEHVKLNVGLWEFIGWLYYYGVFALSNKNAMRTADNVELNKAWMYTTLLSRPAGKKTMPNMD